LWGNKAPLDQARPTRLFTGAAAADVICYARHAPGASPPFRLSPGPMVFLLGAELKGIEKGSPTDEVCRAFRPGALVQPRAPKRFPQSSTPMERRRQSAPRCASARRWRLLGSPSLAFIGK